MKNQLTEKTRTLPSLTEVPIWVSAIPIMTLILALVAVILVLGADAVATWSIYLMAGAGLLAAALAMAFYGVSRRRISAGLMRSFRQMRTCFPLLVLIGTVSTSWMLSGVVPFLVDRGIALLNPTFFLALTCLACAVVSSLTGSSWTTIATVGVAFLGVGSAFGYSSAWTAGAIISGAYFGDKCSPLSDTTVIASTVTGVEIFRLIRYMALTTLPAFTIAVIVFALVGFGHDGTISARSREMVEALGSTFNLTPWVLLVPATTVVLVACRFSTLKTLVGSTIAGIVGFFVFQHGALERVHGITDFASGFVGVCRLLLTGIDIHTGHAGVDSLVSTGGIAGMVSTMLLISAAVLFGGTMIGSGFLDRLTGAMSSRLSRRHSVVGSTLVTGVALNALTADQYISIIIGANIYKNVYRRSGLSPKLLGRSLQDTVVTSVLIPWSSCGVTQTAVLGVPTLIYLPYCLFNILSPVSSFIIATITYRIHRRRLRPSIEH